MLISSIGLPLDDFCSSWMFRWHTELRQSKQFERCGGEQRLLLRVYHQASCLLDALA